MLDLAFFGIGICFQNDSCTSTIHFSMYLSDQSLESQDFVIHVKSFFLKFRFVLSEFSDQIYSADLTMLCVSRCRIVCYILPRRSRWWGTVSGIVRDASVDVTPSKELSSGVCLVFSSFI